MGTENKLTEKRENELKELARTIAEARYKKLEKEIKADKRYITNDKDGNPVLNGTGEEILNQAFKRFNTEKYYIERLLVKDPNYANLPDDAIYNEALHPTNRTPDKIASDLAEDKRKQDFKPLVAFDENGQQPWYNMPHDVLREKARELGYNLEDPNDREEFFSKLRQDSRDVDNAKIVDDFFEGHNQGGSFGLPFTDKRVPDFLGIIADNSGEPWVGKAGVIGASMAYPTATDEAVKQALTGEYDDDKLNSALILDGATNVAISSAPFIGNLGRGWNYVAEPFAQTAVEAWRQGVQKQWNLGDETFNVGDVAGTALAGTVTPMSKNLFAEGLGRTGSAGRSVARGIQSTSASNPIMTEQDALLKAVKRAKQTKALVDNNEPSPYLQRGFGADKRNAMLDADIDVMNDFGGYKKAEKTIKKLYKDPYQFDVHEIDAPTNEVEGLVDKQERLMNRKMENHAPLLLESMGTEKDPLFSKGVWLGNVMGDIGDAVEPALKFNPVTAISPLLSGHAPNFEGQENTNITADNYQFTDWYKSLSKADKERVDKTMKKDGLLTENN